MQTSNSIITALSIMVVTGVTLLFLFTDPIAQDLSYHNFHDARTILGIPNFWNVLSNLPFLVVGVLGFLWTLDKNATLIASLRVVYQLFFVGVGAVAFGSGYYHLSPDNITLVWDRLPMTIAFMALFTIIIAEFISIRIAKAIFLPLVIIGLSSVAYWHISEMFNQGDLRPYALVQFFPMLIIPIILLTFNSPYTGPHTYWFTLGFYVAAKLLEHFDGQTFETIGYISGHSLKHVAAAIGVGVLAWNYKTRKAL